MPTGTWKRHDELYAGAILGTIVNFIFFWVLVKNATGNENSMVYYKSWHNRLIFRLLKKKICFWSLAKNAVK